MMLVFLPALFYGFVHILGLYYPARLWGADQLHYYPLPGAVFFMLIVSVTAGVAAKDSWVLRADETLARLLLDLRRALPAAIWLKADLVLSCIPLTYAFRDQSHHLGDSAKWFAVLDHALLGSTSMDTIPAHHSRLDIPGFEYINFLDVFFLNPRMNAGFAASGSCSWGCSLPSPSRRLPVPYRPA